MPKRRSRAGFSWKNEIGGVPVWGIAVAVIAMFGMLAIPAVVSATTPAAVPYVRPTDAFAEPTPTAEALSVYFLGDSYTGGSDMGGNDFAGWPTIVANQFGWVPTLDGRGGSGYLQTGPGEGAGPFSARLQAAIDAAPDVLIVAGGINDAAVFSTDEIAAAATEQLTALQSALPNTRIVVVGPFYPTAPAPQEWVDADAAIAGVAASLGLPYVQTLPWFEGGAVEIGEDGTHPTDAGHAVLAQRIAEALTGLGIAP